jgi:hypothetical protein
MFVTISEDGHQHWVDHSGRMGRIGGFGGFGIDGQGKKVHFRGNQKLSEQEVDREKEEFTVSVEPKDYDVVAVLGFIEYVGRPWLSGWDLKDSNRLHDMLEAIYWKSVNKFVHNPFNDHDT